MERMEGKWASSRVDLWYTELFSIPEVTSVFLSSCDSGLGTLWCNIKHNEAPYVFDWEHGIALHPVQGIRALTHAEGDDSWDFSSSSRNPGVYSRVTAGMAIRNSTWFSEVRPPV